MATPTYKKQIRKLQRLTKLLKLFPFYFIFLFFLFLFFVATLSSWLPQIEWGLSLQLWLRELRALLCQRSIVPLNELLHQIDILRSS